MGADVPDPFCGATILTPYHALTAAHCTQNDAKKLIDYLGLIVGAHDMKHTNDTQILRIEKFLDHENYEALSNGTFYLNDIALVVLKNEIIFNTNAGPACLPIVPLELKGQYVKVMGWGRTQPEGQGSNVLMQTDLKITPYETCGIFFKLNPQRTQFCTFGKNRDTCRGDSGGPVVWIDPETNKLTLVGVVSHGSKVCGKKPAVSTDVSRYLDWIQNAISSSGKAGKTCQKIRTVV
nr:venom serine protease [Arma chinensis]